MYGSGQVLSAYRVDVDEVIQCGICHGHLWPTDARKHELRKLQGEVHGGANLMSTSAANELTALRSSVHMHKFSRGFVLARRSSEWGSNLISMSAANELTALQSSVHKFTRGFVLARGLSEWGSNLMSMSVAN
jgi:hypothetical protein